MVQDGPVWCANCLHSPELAGYRVFDEMRPSPGVFDLVFKPSQVFHWPQWYKMVRFGARIAYTHQSWRDIAFSMKCGRRRVFSIWYSSLLRFFIGRNGTRWSGLVRELPTLT